MKLSSLLCCDTVLQDSNNKQNLLAPIQAIKLVSCPSTYSFSITVGLIDIDKFGEDKIAITIENEAGQVINGLNSINLPNFPEELNENDPYGAFLNFDIRNMVFEEPGLYSIKVISADTLLGELFIRVFV